MVLLAVLVPGQQVSEIVAFERHGQITVEGGSRGLEQKQGAWVGSLRV